MELNVVGTDQYAMVSSALRYVLSQNIAITIPVFRSIEEVEVASKAGNEFNGLTRDEKTASMLCLMEVTVDTAVFACVALRN